MTFSQKKLGCCLACGQEVYQVLSYYTEGPLEGHPNRVGPMLATGCQVEFFLSDGSTADVAFCRDCAGQLRPADYWPAWVACWKRAQLAFEIDGRRPAEQRLRLLPMLQVWPVGVKCWRKEAQESHRLVLARKTDD